MNRNCEHSNGKKWMYLHRKSRWPWSAHTLLIPFKSPAKKHNPVWPTAASFYAAEKVEVQKSTQQQQGQFNHDEIPVLLLS